MGWTELSRSALVRVRDTYGEPGAVTYEPSGLADVVLTAYFRAASFEVDLELAVAVNTTNPTLALLGEDLPQDPTSADYVRIGSPHFATERRYRVTKAEPDGHGWWVVSLVRAQDVTP